MLHIIIPVYKGWSQLRQCLDALRHSTCRDFTVIVVDHGPTDAISTKLHDYKEVISVRGDPSLWWAGATNLGIEYALSQQADRIMLLNHDCYVAGKTISTLLEHGARKRDAIIAPIQKEAGSDKILLIAPKACIWLGFADGRQGPQAIPPDMGTEKLLPASLIRGGRGVIIPANVFRQIGLLDQENLPHYYADHDFFLRCRSQKIPLYTAVDAEVFIDNRQTTQALKPEELTVGEFIRSFSSRRSHRNMRDLRMLFRKHYPVKFLYLIGFFLSVLRYTVVYAGKRLKKVVEG